VSDGIGLYIHIPFCRSRCRYCSFVSFERREADIPRYLDALKIELARRAHGEHVSSIYLGGGTPSLLPVEATNDLLQAIRALFYVDKTCEITLEANPGTVDESHLSALRKSSVNRISLGVQSLDDHELKMLGRIHTAAEVREAVRAARKAGFDNINMDLIYGLPGQTADNWRMTLESALDMDPEHISLYALSLEQGLPMQRAIDDHELPEIDPDLAADQYELAGDFLDTRGYRHYEISNWAKAGRECRHNIIYWQNKPYLGAGVAAHSWLNGHRLANTANIDTYMNMLTGNTKLAPDMDEEITPELQLAETIILGLRMCDGISVRDVSDRFDEDILAHYGRQVGELSDLGLMEYTGGNLRLTRRGCLLSNEVFWRFLPEKKQP
jgi:oxygen-independent coproporphyrinogen-3 oxidase